MSVTTELTVQNIADVKNAATNYQSECQNLFAQLNAVIQGIQGTSFVGDAELGYYTDANSFFNQMKPYLTTQVDNLVQGITNLLTQIQAGLLDAPDGADPQIGTQNKEAGAGAETPAAQ